MQGSVLPVDDGIFRPEDGRRQRGRISIAEPDKIPVMQVLVPVRHGAVRHLIHEQSRLFQSLFPLRRPMAANGGNEDEDCRKIYFKCFH